MSQQVNINYIVLFAFHKSSHSGIYVTTHENNRSFVLPMLPKHFDARRECAWTHTSVWSEWDHYFTRTVSSIISQHTAPSYQITSESGPKSNTPHTDQTSPWLAGPHVWNELIWRARERAHPSQTCQFLPCEWREEHLPTAKSTPPLTLAPARKEPNQNPNQLVSSWPLLTSFAALQLFRNRFVNDLIRRPRKTNRIQAVIITSAPTIWMSDLCVMFVSLTHPLKRWHQTYKTQWFLPCH